VKHMPDFARSDGKPAMRLKNSRTHHLGAITKKPKNRLLGIAILIVICSVIIATFVQSLRSEHSRNESYKNTTGGAGLEATIKYDCPKQPCNYDFNVYIYKSDGAQVNVVRPDKDGVVHLAMAEGEYTMLVGKLFGDNKTFPQEPLTLKNGKTLELKLEYK